MSEDTGDSLDVVRARIDAIDREIARLLNERAAGARQVARIKAAEDTDESPVFYRPEREAQILKRVLAENTGPLTDRDLWQLFREIISCCLSLEQPLTVAYLGPPGTYTEAAAVKHFGHFALNRAQNSIDEVFHEVESGSAHCGVVPVENSTEGMVNHTLDCFMASRLRICGEVKLPINHAFMSLEKPDAVTAVYSHEQSLAQCRRWLDRHYPNIARTPMVSNAEAARVAARTDGAAAIAGEMAAERYGLRVLANNIEDETDNETRFLVVGDQSVGPSGRDKTSPPRVHTQTSRGPCTGSWSRFAVTASTFRASRRVHPGLATGATSFLSISMAMKRPKASPRCWTKCARWPPRCDRSAPIPKPSFSPDAAEKHQRTGRWPDAVPARQAHRGTDTRTRPRRHHQAGQQREPARAGPAGARRD